MKVYVQFEFNGKIRITNVNYLTEKICSQIQRKFRVQRTRKRKYKVRKCDCEKEEILNSRKIETPQRFRKNEANNTLTK